jgi:hypothetical protein
MYLVTIRLRRGTATAPADAGRVAAALLDVKRPEDGLEHVYAQPAPQGVDVVAFLVALPSAYLHRLDDASGSAA